MNREQKRAAARGRKEIERKGKSMSQQVIQAQQQVEEQIQAAPGRQVNVSTILAKVGALQIEKDLLEQELLQAQAFIRQLTLQLSQVPEGDQALPPGAKLGPGGLLLPDNEELVVPEPGSNVSQFTRKTDDPESGPEVA